MVLELGEDELGHVLDPAHHLLQIELAVENDHPLGDVLGEIADPLMSRVEGATIHAQWMRERPEDYSVHLGGRLYAGYAIPAVHYVEALSRRGPILRALGSEVFGKVDVFATPTPP